MAAHNWSCCSVRLNDFPAHCGAATAYVCIRRMHDPVLGLLFWHCWVESGTWSAAYYQDAGVCAEVSRYTSSRNCKKIQTNLVKVASMLQSEKVRQDATGNWDPADYKAASHNCCHYVNTLIQATGSAKNIMQYFPGYYLPGI